MEITVFDIETPLKFEGSNENPSYVLANNNPTYLNCHVTYTLDKKLSDDFQRKFYPGKNDEIDENDEDYENEDVDGDEILKNYERQNQLYNPKSNSNHVTKTRVETLMRKKRISPASKLSNSSSTMESLNSSSSISSESSEEMTDARFIELYKEQRRRYEKNRPRIRKRSTNEINKDDDSVKKFYEWYKNGLLINETSENETEKLFEILPNGTLKIFVSPESAGRYYCNVRAEVKINKKIMILGPIISRSTLVEVPSKFYNNSLHFNFIIKFLHLRSN